MTSAKSTKMALWLRLRDYHFENLTPPQLFDRVAEMFGGKDASTRAFAGKIARKMGWKQQFALRAIDEYKKFVYLGIVSDFPVSPPKVIDQVWHEHLLFSRGYREFCQNVLHHNFDHNPELVSVAEQTSTFAAQYEATLALYSAEFNRTPPSDFWGTPKFKQQQKSAPARPPRKSGANAVLVSGGDTPLYECFADSDSNEFGEFGGSGEFSGGGGGSDWGDSSSSSSNDSGGSDSSGSSCSSGCGGE